jgi:hypothetical protein
VHGNFITGQLSGQICGHLAGGPFPGRSGAEHLLVEEMSVAGGVTEVASHVLVLGETAVTPQIALPHSRRLGRRVTRRIAPIRIGGKCVTILYLNIASAIKIQRATTKNYIML